MAGCRFFLLKGLNRKFGRKKGKKFNKEEKPPNPKQAEDSQQDHANPWVGFFNSVMMAVLLHPRVSADVFAFPMAIMTSWYDTLRFVANSHDFKLVIRPNLLNVKVLTRSPLTSYISLGMEDAMIYDNETDGFKSLKLLTGNEELHVTLSYCCNFGTYNNLHKRCYRARSFIGGLSGDEIWAATRVYFSKNYIGLRILPTSDLHGVLSNLADVFEEEFNNFHVTLYTFN
jgi:hypothetical protein